MGNITRRFLLGTGAVVGGGLALGYAFAPNRLTLSAPGVAVKDEVLLNTWVKITPDNVVTVIVPHSEMGQGSQTGLPMMLAEELEADMSLVRMEEAPAHPNYANNELGRGFIVGNRVPDFMLRQVDFAFFKLAQSMNLQITGGSTAVRYTGEVGMRRAGAAAKQMLLSAAAEEWDVPVFELEAKQSVITHTPSGRSATFGALSTAAAKMTPDPSPKLKDPKDFTIIGTNFPRYDVPSKVNGSALFGIDAKVPGLLYGAVRKAPVHGGRVESHDAQAIAGRRGVKGVVDLGDCVVVVADNYWRAEQAAAALPIRFSDGGHGNVSSETVFADLENVVRSDKKGKTDTKSGDAYGTIETSGRVVEASYKVPFLSHAAMEPMNCTAHVNGKTCEVWVGHQNPLGGRAAVAEILDTDIENVTFNNTLMGGGFGRRSETDNLRIAVLTSQKMGAPVKVIFSREQDIQHDFYRPAVVSDMKAALGEDGLPVAWANRYSNIGNNEPEDSPLIPYNIANQDIRGVESSVHIQLGPWRSVGHTQHSFFNESFVDELAHAAERDPYDYRRDLLAHSPRHRDVLVLAAEKAGWGTPVPAGRARGIAMEHSFGSIVAQVAEISLDEFGQVRVHKVTAAVDCGRAVNPGLVEAQIQSGIIYGLTATLYGNIEIENGAVRQSNFPDYEMIRLAQAPEMAVHILNSGEAFGGIGEPGTPPIAPAVANAVFSLTGQRVRELPLNKHQFKVKDSTPQVSMRM